MVTAQQAGWEQGCRAVFAGFVAASNARALEATLEAFWDSEQKDIILPSLLCLKSQLGEQPKMTLYNIINSKDNKFTRMTAMVTDDKDSWEEVAWELTRSGKRAFPKAVVAVQPKLAPRKGSWWDE